MIQLEDSSLKEEIDVESLADHLHGRHEYKLKMDILVFDGRLDIEEVLDQIQTTEAYFEYMEIHKFKQVKYVAYKLKKGLSLGGINYNPIDGEGARCCDSLITKERF